jgi:hypothetical protein
MFPKTLLEVYALRRQQNRPGGSPVAARKTEQIV